MHNISSQSAFPSWVTCGHRHLYMLKYSLIYPSETIVTFCTALIQPTALPRPIFSLRQDKLSNYPSFSGHRRLRRLSWILCFKNCPTKIWPPQLPHVHTQTGKMWRGLGPWLPSLALSTLGAQGPSAHRSPTLGLVIATTTLVMSTVSPMHP